MNDNDPSPDPTWRVRVVRDDLSDLGTSHVVMQHPQGVSLSGIGVAIGSGYRGAVVWDDAQGCRFVQLGANGAPTAAPQGITKSWCYWPIATPSGFVLFNSPAFTFAPLRLLSLDKSGQVTQTHPGVINSNVPQTYPAGIAHFNDGSLLVTWRVAGGTIVGQHLDRNGNKLAPQNPMLPISNAVRYAIASMGNLALTVTGDNHVYTEPFDEDGQNKPPSQLAQVAAGTGHVAVARAGNVALVGWSEGPSGAYHTLRVRPVDFSGKPLGPSVVVSTLSFIGTIRLIGTPAGALVVFEAERPNTPTQVFAVPLVCHS